MVSVKLANFVSGSPEPHGEDNTVAKDGHLGMSFYLVLGSYLSSLQNLQVKLDTELFQHDLENHNIITIGGAIVNNVTKKLNKYSPIHFTKEKTFISKVSNKEYDETNIGVVSKFKNPFNKHKEVISLLGIGKKGTQTAVLSFLHHFDQIEEGNTENTKKKCNVFLGRDYHSTNEITKIEVLG